MVAGPRRIRRSNAPAVLLAVGSLLLLLTGCTVCVQQGTAQPEVASGVRGEEVPLRVRRFREKLGNTAASVHLPLAAGTPLPGVLVVHSSLGLTDSVLAHCDALAEAGYGVYAPDLFRGARPATAAAAVAARDEAVEHSSELDAVLRTAYERLASDLRIRARKRYLLGWSFGAGWVTLLSASLPEVTGTVAFYGEAFSDHPHLATRVYSPLLLIGGRRDKEPSIGNLFRLSETLSRQGKRSTLYVAEAGHGFAERQHPGWDEAADKASWERALAFLREAAEPEVVLAKSANPNR